MSQQKQKGSVLEQGLLSAMQAIDNQIARAMERNPAERETHGVQKWEPINNKVEQVCVFLMNALGDDEIKLDSLLVLYQSLSKSLLMVVEDLGEEGLGKMRSSYCLSALENITVDVERAKKMLKGTTDLM
ncbi:MAG: hypothetical protein KBC84_10205 [Proteobacteria bacterium]|nr:hypothetical protein [Pseudomonadota bacterium]